MKINNFAVLKAMAEGEKDIRLAPMSNILNARYTKRGTQITFGVEGNVVGAILRGDFIGGLILADKAQFEETKRELGREAAGSLADAREGEWGGSW